MTDPLGPVVITTREIYDQLVRLGDAVRDALSTMAKLADGQDEIKRDVADHETRLRSLERSRWPLPSLAAVVSLLALAGTITTIIIMMRR